MDIELGDIVSSTELTRNTAQLVKAASEGRRILVMTKNTATAALIGIDDLRLLHRSSATTLNQPPSDDIEAAAVDPETYLAALGIDDLQTWSAQTHWASHADSHALPAPIGIAADQSIVTLDLADPALGGTGPHCAMQGATGMGKSTALQTLILSLCVAYPPSRIQFLFATSRRHALRALPHMLPVPTGEAIDRWESFTSAETALRAEIDRRQHVMRDANARSVQEFRKTHPEGIPDLFVVIDEYGDLIATTARSKQFTSFVATIAKRGRGLGIHLVLCDQRHESTTFRAVADNLTCRISMPTPHSSHDSRLFMGGSDVASRLPARPGSAALLRHDATIQRGNFFNSDAKWPADSESSVCEALVERICSSAD